MRPDIKGLTKLARELRKVPRNKFNIGEWWMKAPCGTSGCIAGHAAAIFPHRFKRENEYADGSEAYINYDVKHRASGTYGSEAFANGFKISLDDAEDITLENHRNKRTPKAAAKAVMALVGRLKKSLKK